MMALFKLIHLLSIVVWVGGMFFAYVVLRPGAAQVLQPPERLQLWDKVFNLFFKWVWGASCLVLASGLGMISQYGSMAHVPYYIHIMLLLGMTMLLVFAYVYFGQYVNFTRVVAAKDWPQAAKILATIRKLVATNLLIAALIFVVVELSH